MKRSLSLAILIALHTFDVENANAQTATANDYLDCAADGQMAMILSRTAYEQGYDVTIRQVRKLEGDSLEYIKQGLASGTLRRSDLASTTEYVQQRVPQLLENSLSNIDGRDPGEYANSIADRHWRSCQWLIALP